MIYELLTVLGFVPGGGSAIPEPTSFATLSFLMSAAFLIRNRPRRREH